MTKKAGFKARLSKVVGKKKKGKKMSNLSSSKPASSPMGFSKVKSYDKSKMSMKPLKGEMF